MRPLRRLGTILACERSGAERRATPPRGGGAKPMGLSKRAGSRVAERRLGRALVDSSQSVPSRKRKGILGEKVNSSARRALGGAFANPKRKTRPRGG